MIKDITGEDRTEQFDNFDETEDTTAIKTKAILRRLRLPVCTQP